MTAPSGPIVFNADTGSDVAASGLGPATAVTGIGASTTGSSAVVTGIDTTGVTAGDLLWVQSSSGRQFSIIATVDSGSQVTCDDVFANTESGRTWAIGGKRATWGDANSRTLFGSSGAKDYWHITTETGQSISAVIPCIAAAQVTLSGSGARRTLLQTGSAACLSGGLVNWRVHNLRLANSNATKTNAYGVLYNAANSSITDFRDVIFGDATNKLRRGVFRSASSQANAYYTDCVAEHCTEVGIDAAGGATGAQAYFIRTISRHNGSHGIDMSSVSATGTVLIESCIIHDNGAKGLLYSGNGSPMIRGSVFASNAGDGIEITTTGAWQRADIQTNIFANNGGCGIRGRSEADDLKLAVNLNAFLGNTSGQVIDLTNGPDDITLTADPFVNAAAGNFNINDTAGGGALLRAATVVMP